MVINLRTNDREELLGWAALLVEHGLDFRVDFTTFSAEVTKDGKSFTRCELSVMSKYLDLARVLLEIVP